MLQTPSKLSVGSIVWGESGSAYRVDSLKGAEITLRPGSKLVYQKSVLRAQESIPLAVGTKAVVLGTRALGFVTHFDPVLGVRLCDIEGLTDAHTGHVISKWFQPDQIAGIEQGQTPSESITGTSEDYQDAIGLIDLADNPDAIQAVNNALGTAFIQPEKQEIWSLLTPSQRAKLKGVSQ